MKTQLNRIAIAALSLVAIAVGSNAQAQTTIDQNKALAGNITPGDAAGFPITLSVTGSYKLTGNLVVPANTRGIEIQADGVTLDLNGFSISGPVTCNTSVSPPCTAPANANMHGITNNNEGAVIRNGSVRGFAGSGIWMKLPGGVVVQDMLLAYNSGSGIMFEPIGGGLLDGGARVTRVVAVQNGGSGIYINGPATAVVNIDNSTASGNGLDGFSLSGGRGSISNCVAEANRRYGLVADSFSLLRGSRFLNNAFGEISGAPRSGGGNLSGATLF